MSARLANTAVLRRHARLCSTYTQAQAGPWSERLRGAPPGRRSMTVANQESGAPNDRHPDNLDRAVLELLLKSGSPARIRVPALTSALQSIEPEELIASVCRHRANGVLVIQGAWLELSRCTRRIGELGLIG